jgi:hypothetical protein
LNAHSVRDIRQLKIHTTEPLVHGLSPFEVEVAVVKLKKYKLSVSDQILEELTEAGGKTLMGFANSLILCGIRKSIVVPIYRKGDKSDYNYNGMSLLSTSYKILSNIILSGLNPYIDEGIGDHQCGSRYKRSTTYQIFCIRQILEKKWEYNEMGIQ